MGRSVSPPVPWGLRHVALVILCSIVLIFLIQIFFIFAVGVYGGFQGISSETLVQFIEQQSGASPWREIFLSIQILVELFFLKLFVLDRFPLPDNFFFPARQWKWDLRCALRFFGWALVGMIVLGMVLLLVVSIVALLAGENPGLAREAWSHGAKEESERFLTPINSSWLMILLAVTVVPAIEEILFRGLLYGAFKKHCAVWIANLASSLVFAMIHSYFYGFYTVFLLGIFLAYAYEKTRSLRTAIIIHCFWNFWVLSYDRSFAAIPFALMLTCWLISHRAESPIDGETVRSPTVFWHGLFWKIYAPLFQVIMVGGSLTHSERFSMILFEAPAYLAVYLYAFHRRWFAPRLWRIYGVAYLFYFALDIADNVQDAAGQMDQLVGGLLFCVLLYGPSIWAIRSMAFPRPENS